MELRQFYLRHGFRVFGRAFSRYYYANSSIPNLVNFTTEPDAKLNHVPVRLPPRAPEQISESEPTQPD
jgi:hypothetical protein